MNKFFHFNLIPPKPKYPWYSVWFIVTGYDRDHFPEEPDSETLVLILVGGGALILALAVIVSFVVVNKHIRNVRTYSGNYPNWQEYSLHTWYGKGIGKV